MGRTEMGWAGDLVGAEYVIATLPLTPLLALILTPLFAVAGTGSFCQTNTVRGVSSGVQREVVVDGTGRRTVSSRTYSLRPHCVHTTHVLTAYLSMYVYALRSLDR